MLARPFFPCSSVHEALNINVFLLISVRQMRIWTGTLDIKLAAVAFALELK